MNFGAVLFLALGLAMDATAVATARGCAAARIRARDALLIAGLFGGFQALMPALGWLIGSQVASSIQAWDHWIAFSFLLGIGGKMLWEARSSNKQDCGSSTQKDESPRESGDLFAIHVLLLLAIATSIDALAVGFTLPILNAPFALSLATIGVVTALLCSLGLFVGQRFGKMLGSSLEVFGGLVLVGLGIKILVEHWQHV